MGGKEDEGKVVAVARRPLRSVKPRRGVRG